MGKYTVGQQVRVRNDIAEGVRYKNNLGGTECAVLDMCEMRGKVITIKADRGDGYRMKEIGYTWTDTMLEPVESVEPLMPSAVLQLESISKIEIYVERVIVNDPATILFYRTGVYDQNGIFMHWNKNLKKIVAKCNKDIGDKFDVGKGVEVALLKAYRKEIDKLLRKV